MQKVIYSGVRLSDDATYRMVKEQFYEIKFTIAAERENSTGDDSEVDWVPIITHAKSDKQVEYFTKRLLKGAEVEFVGRLFIDPFIKDKIRRKNIYVKVPIRELNITKLANKFASNDR